MSWKKNALIAIPAIALMLAASGVARADLVTNGGFETTTTISGGGITAPINGSGQLGYNLNATGWTVNGGLSSSIGYTFLYTPAAATTSGTHADNGGGSGNAGTVVLYGPGSGGSSTNHLTTSPNGGNFIATDPSYPGQGQQSISQSISGLVVGAQVAVSFSWAGAQQSAFTGSTSESWSVSLGGSPAQSTATVNVAQGGFSGWMAQTFIFTATAATETLTFLAGGGPNGTAPPFVLLDGVSVNLVATPEPSTLVFMGTGLLGLGAVRLLRRRKAAAA